jgi:hypothetical protein
MATPNEKLQGKYLQVEWVPDDGGATVLLDVYSRNFSVKQAAKDIDVSTRADVYANSEDILAGVPTRDVTIGGLDSDENTPDWDLIETGDSGTLKWYRRRKVTGMPVKSMTARVTGGGDFDSPHDGPNTWSLTFKGTSAITSGLVS